MSHDVHIFITALINAGSYSVLDIGHVCQFMGINDVLHKNVYLISLDGKLKVKSD